MALLYVQLDLNGWAQLEILISKNQSNSTITKRLLKQLRELDAKSMLVETEFLNRDFTESYAAYYSRTFRRHTKLCTRISFFSVELPFLNEQGTTTCCDRAQSLEEVGEQSFLGFVVLRPITQAPISEIILKLPCAPIPYEARQLVRTLFEIHVAGAKLKIVGVPVTQQDSRTGACAQAAIWSSARFFHARHHGPWLTTIDITKAALTTLEFNNNLHLPAGSEFLTGNNMSTALRAAGREPLFYARAAQGNWGALRPHDIINRYIDSGIPVIVGLSTGQEVGHAVVAIGQALRQTCSNNTLPPKPTRAEFCEGFYVHDDQMGSNVCMPVDAGSPLSECQYSVNSNVQYILIPLPSKVYLPAEKAEVLAWTMLGLYVQDWLTIKAMQSMTSPTEQLGDSLCSDHAGNKIFARTYLTYGWKYKYRSLRNCLSEPMKAFLSAIDLPRFVYVTEFSRLQDCENLLLRDRRVIAHCVVDATAKNTDLDAVLIFHAPGFCRRMQFDEQDDLVPAISFLTEDNLYFPKVRGDENFSSFLTY